MTHSVIVPVYNSESYIQKCVLSLVNQSIDDVEIILVDDGSTDNSSAICDELASTYTNVVVFHKRNGGVSSARNYGISKANGEYVYFVDSDDYVDPLYIEHLNVSDADLVVGAYVIENTVGEIRKEKAYVANCFSLSESDIVIDYFINGIFNYPFSKRFKRDLIESGHIEFNQTMSLGEDTVFVVDYISRCGTFNIITASDYHYIKQDDKESLSTQALSNTLVDKLEYSNSVICPKLKKIYRDSSVLITTKRMIPLYENFIHLIVNSDYLEKSLIKYMFSKVWFRRVLSDKDSFKDENVKFRFILRTKSWILFYCYLKYIKRKRNG